MSAANPQLLLDANVWVDFFVPGRTGSATASRLVRDALERGAQLFYSSRIVTELFLEVRRDAAEWVRASTGELSKEAARLCHEFAWGCMQDLHELATAVPADDADVEAVLRYRRLSEDIEDNFLLVAAQRADVDYLVTSDQVLLGKATVAALTPQDMLTVLAARL